MWNFQGLGESRFCYFFMGFFCLVKEFIGIFLSLMKFILWVCLLGIVR